MLLIFRTTCLSAIHKRLIVFGSRFFNHQLLDSNEQLISENSFSLSNVKKILKTKFITYNDGFTNIAINCPVCEKNNELTDASKVFINKITGYFVCYQCKHSGNWNNLESLLINRKTKLLFEKFHQETKQNNDEEIEVIINNILSSTTLLSSLDEDNFIEILTKFQLPINSKELYDLIAVRFDQNNNCILFPLKDLTEKIVGFKKLSLIRNKVCESTIPVKNCSGLLIGKTNKVRSNHGIIVTTVTDFMLLLSSKINLNVILLPHSVHSLPQVLLPNFEKFSKLIFWFKNDIESWTATRDLAKKLIDTRCYVIRESDPKTAVNDPKLLKNSIDGAQPVWHKFITTFATLRDEVLSELGNLEKVQGVKWNRFPTLTKILKGHRRGELTIVTGPTGSGKTTFISEYSLDLAMENVNTLWGSFEIRNVRLAKTMLQQMAEVELESNLERFDEFANAFEQLPIYFMTFHGQQSVKVVMEAIEHATYVHDISHVIIDNIQFMMGVMDDSRNVDRFWRQDAVIASFRTFATKRNCHVTLVIHPRKERDTDDLTTSSIFGGAKASQEADNVLIVQDKRLSSVRGKKYLQIVKNRYSGDLGVMPLIFNKTSLSFSEKKQKSNSSDVEENPADPTTT